MILILNQYQGGLLRCRAPLLISTEAEVSGDRCPGRRLHAVRRDRHRAASPALDGKRCHPWVEMRLIQPEIHHLVGWLKIIIKTIKNQQYFHKTQHGFYLVFILILQNPSQRFLWVFIGFPTENTIIECGNAKNFAYGALEALKSIKKTCFLLTADENPHFDPWCHHHDTEDEGPVPSGEVPSGYTHMAALFEETNSSLILPTKLSIIRQTYLLLDLESVSLDGTHRP